MPDLRVISPRLPLRTRGRLRAERRITAVGCWLIDRGRCRAAELLWRACRML